MIKTFGAFNNNPNAITDPGITIGEYWEVIKKLLLLFIMVLISLIVFVFIFFILFKIELICIPYSIEL